MLPVTAVSPGERRLQSDTLDGHTPDEDEHCREADIAPYGAPDGRINVADLLTVLAAFGMECVEDEECNADISGNDSISDGKVNVLDNIILAILCISILGCPSHSSEFTLKM
jgi:hypothetical protein